jgi:hypothetical protein
MPQDLGHREARRIGRDHMQVIVKSTNRQTNAPVFVENPTQVSRKPRKRLPADRALAAFRGENRVDCQGCVCVGHGRLTGISARNPRKLSLNPRPPKHILVRMIDETQPTAKSWPANAVPDYMDTGSTRMNRLAIHRIR